MVLSRRNFWVITPAVMSTSRSTGSPLTFSAAARTATRPTLAGSVAIVATHGLSGLVMTPMSGVEMSAP